MQLKTNSFHAVIYQFFYNTEKLPDNLCPYFWKLVIAFIFVIPYTVACLPHLIIKRRLIDPYNIGFFDRPGIGMQWYIGIAVVLGLLLCWYHAILAVIGAYSYDRDLATFGSIMFWVFIFVGGLISLYLWKEKRELYRHDEEYKPKQPSIIVEFIKAKYNNYCPKINWSHPQPPKN